MRRVVAVMVTVMACGGKLGKIEPVVNTSSPAETRPPALAPTSRALVQDLAEIDWFALGSIRSQSGTSRGEELTRALSREPDAIEAFTWLGGQSAPVPRLYAYWALRTLAPDRAAALAPRLRQDRSRIKRLSGCIASRWTVAGILRYLERDYSAPVMPHPQRARGSHGETR